MNWFMLFHVLVISCFFLIKWLGSILYNPNVVSYHTLSKHRANCSADHCVQQVTPAHGEQSSTQQSTTQRRQSFEVARCRLRYIYWKTWTTRRANIDHKHKTRHRDDGFHRATHKEKNQIEESGCWLLPQGSSVAGPQLTQTVRLSSIAVPLAPHVVHYQANLPPDSFLSRACGSNRKWLLGQSKLPDLVRADKSAMTFMPGQIAHAPPPRAPSQSGTKKTCVVRVLSS